MHPCCWSQRRYPGLHPQRPFAHACAFGHFLPQVPQLFGIGCRAGALATAAGLTLCTGVPAGPAVIGIGLGIVAVVLAVDLAGRAFHAAFALVTRQAGRALPPAPATVFRIGTMNVDAGPPAAHIPAQCTGIHGHELLDRHDALAVRAGFPDRAAFAAGPAVAVVRAEVDAPFPGAEGKPWITDRLLDNGQGCCNQRKVPSYRYLFFLETVIGDDCCHRRSPATRRLAVPAVPVRPPRCLRIRFRQALPGCRAGRGLRCQGERLLHLERQRCCYRHPP